MATPSILSQSQQACLRYCRLGTPVQRSIPLITPCEGCYQYLASRTTLNHNDARHNLRRLHDSEQAIRFHKTAWMRAIGTRSITGWVVALQITMHYPRSRMVDATGTMCALIGCSRCAQGRSTPTWRGTGIKYACQVEEISMGSRSCVH